MVGVAGRVEVLWGVGERCRSGYVGVQVEELWFDKGAIVQQVLGLYGCGMNSNFGLLQALHVLKGSCNRFNAGTGVHARSLHAI